MKKVIIALVIVLVLTMFASCSMDNIGIENVVSKFDALEADVKAGNDISAKLAKLATNLENVDSLVTSNNAGSKVGITYDVYMATKHVAGNGGGLNLALNNANTASGVIKKISHADMYTYYFTPYRVELILVYGE